MRFRNILPVILALAALSSCSVYRSGQTPDDVYYSPGRPADDSYLTVNNPRKGSSDYGRYDNSTNTNPDDNYLRMRQYGSRWNTFDSYNDWQYNGGYYGAYSPYYSPYSSSFYGPSFYGGYGGFYGGYGIGMPYAYGYYNPWAINAFNPYWNSYYYWNSCYNPYAGGIIVGGAKSNPVVYQSARNFRLNSYTNNNYNTRNVSGNRSIYNANPNGRYSTSNGNNNRNSGGLRRSNDSYYTPTQRSSNPTYSNPTYSNPSPVRTYSPSSSGGSYGGGSGGGGGTGSGGARPSRGH